MRPFRSFQSVLVVSTLFGACGPALDLDSAGLPLAEEEERVEAPAPGTLAQGLTTDICSDIRTDLTGTSFPAISRAALVANGKTYVDFRWTPQPQNIANPTGSSRCGYVVRTSNFTPGVPQPFPYKKAGYDTIFAFQTCIGHAYGGGLYLGGTIDQVSLGRGCGVLGLDCAGFIGKAFAVPTNAYANPSFIHNACPQKNSGTNIWDVKPGDLMKRYGVTGKQTHFQLIAAAPDTVNRRITVYEAGTGDPSQRGDIVKAATYSWDFLINEGFRLCRPNGLTEP